MLPLDAEVGANDGDRETVPSSHEEEGEGARSKGGGRIIPDAERGQTGSAPCQSWASQ